MSDSENYRMSEWPTSLRITASWVKEHSYVAKSVSTSVRSLLHEDGLAG
jgi:hypothetical protein